MENVDKTIKELGDSSLKIMKGAMASKGVKTLQNDLFVKRTSKGFIIKGSKAVTFADSGRKPGKMPPIKDIKAWVKKRGIPVSAVYPIALKISKRGTKGKDFIELANTMIANNATDKLGDAAVKDVLNNIKDIKI